MMIKRRGLILRRILTGITLTLGISVMISLIHHLIFRAVLSEEAILAVLECVSLLAGLWYLSWLGQDLICAYGLILLVWISATYLVITSSVQLPIVDALYMLAILLTGILVGARAGLIVTLATGLTVFGLGYPQAHQHLRPDLNWADHLLDFDAVIGFVAIIGVVGLISWLSNNELNRSLEYSSASESALKLERDNLERAVFERTLELQRFAEFGRMTAGLLHDLANPLATASLSLDRLSLLQRSRLALQARKSVYSLERYVTSARRQLQQESQIRRFTVAAELRQVMNILEHRAKINHVSVIFEAPHVRLNGDPVKFNQLAANLISNAIDAYTESLLPIPKRLVRVSVLKRLNVVVLTVIDHGNGIPSGHIERIFEAFYSTKTPGGRGTGLGLSIAKRIVEQDFDGVLTVTSAPETGTTFTAQLRSVPKLTK